MKKIIVTLLIFSTHVCYGQTADQFLKLFSFKQPASYSDLKKELDLYNAFQKDQAKDTSGYLDTRIIDMSFNFDKRVFEVTINHINNKIFWFRVTEYRDDSGPHFPGLLSRGINDIEITYIDSAFINSLLSPYNLKNDTDFSWQDLFNDSTDAFGYVCGGFVPVENISYQKVMNNVKLKDHASLLRRCKSLLPHVRVYGALGLYLLKRMGQPLNKEEISLFEQIKKSTETITTCQGCVYKNWEPVCEAISDERLNEFYEYSEAFLKSK